MTALTAWYDHVLPYLNGCPTPLALQKIRESAIAYCRLSRAWRYLGLTPIDAVAGQQTYVIGTGAAVGTLPEGTTIVHVFQVNWAEEPIEACTPAAFQAKSATWFDDAGEPEAFTLFREGEVSLWRIPEETEADAIVIPDVALAPSQTATTVDDTIFEHALDVIATGALARVHSIPNKPYTDLMYGRDLMQAFNAAAGSDQARSASGRGHARLRTQTIIR